jgi:hypothetical protein
VTARTARRERAIQAVIRTGRIPAGNVKWSEFCDLVRAAARVRETQGEFPRGWSNAAIVKAARKISRCPAVLCERCKTEISLANALDAEPEIIEDDPDIEAGGIGCAHACTERSSSSSGFWVGFDDH